MNALIRFDLVAVRSEVRLNYMVSELVESKESFHDTLLCTLIFSFYPVLKSCLLLRMAVVLPVPVNPGQSARS